MHLPYRTYAEINLAKVRRNTLKVKQLLNDGCKLLSVLKADGYGHGAVRIAQEIEDLSDWFAVASFEEAIALRENGIEKPILVFGFIDDSYIEKANLLNITCSCLSYEYAIHLEEQCAKKNLKLDVHIELDTGFNRLGIRVREEEFEYSYKLIKSIFSLKHLNVTGIFTHFATSGFKCEEDIYFQNQQFKLFKNVLEKLSEEHIDYGISHCCNSKATLTNPEMHLDMVRVGLYLYGLGSDDDISKLKLEPIVNWRARIYAIRTIEPGESVGYNRMFFAKKKMKIGIVSIGFADGYFRCLYNSDKVYVLINGQRTKILGKICMDVLMIDLTDIKNVEVNDYITLLGFDGNDSISPNLLGKETGGTAGEITCDMGKRVTRIYTYD